MKTIKVRAIIVVPSKSTPKQKASSQQAWSYSKNIYDVYVVGVDDNTYLFPARNIYKDDVEDLYKERARSSEIVVWKQKTNRARKRGGHHRIMKMGLRYTKDQAHSYVVLEGAYRMLPNFKKEDIFEDLFDMQMRSEGINGDDQQKI